MANADSTVLDTETVLSPLVGGRQEQRIPRAFTRCMQRIKLAHDNATVAFRKNICNIINYVIEKNFSYSSYCFI